MTNADNALLTANTNGANISVMNMTVVDHEGRITALENSPPGASAPGAPTLVVAASDALQKIKDRADYVCTGINDHLMIQAALDELGVGGRVILTQGTFNLHAAILLDNRQTIEGQGEGTILRPQGGVTWAAQDGLPEGALIELKGQDISAAKVARLRITGVRSTYSLRGIYLHTTSNPTSNPDSEHKIHQVLVEFCGNNPVYITGSANRAGKVTQCRFASNNAEFWMDGADWEIGETDVAGSGILCDGANNRWSNVKSFFAGGLAGGANGLVLSLIHI